MSEITYPLLEKQNTVVALIADIGTRLKRLDISTPESKESDSLAMAVQWWVSYLMILTPLADVGDISNARRIRFSDGKVDAPISPNGRAQMEPPEQVKAGPPEA